MILPMGRPQWASPGAGHRASEEAIHRAVVQLLERAACANVAWTHMPAGEARGPGTGGKLKGLRLKPGWPDLLLVKAGRLYGLELKAAGGRGSAAQAGAHAALARAGATVAVAHGLDAAIAQLKTWGMVR